MMEVEAGVSMDPAEKGYNIHPHRGADTVQSCKCHDRLRNSCRIKEVPPGLSDECTDHENPSQNLDPKRPHLVNIFPFLFGIMFFGGRLVWYAGFPNQLKRDWKACIVDPVAWEVSVAVWSRVGLGGGISRGISNVSVKLRNWNSAFG